MAVECIMIENQGKQKHFEQSTEPKRKQNQNTKKINRKRKEDSVQKKMWHMYI